MFNINKPIVYDVKSLNIYLKLNIIVFLDKVLLFVRAENLPNGDLRCR